MFKKPKQLEGLSPETKVVIQVSLEPLQAGLVEIASITVNTSDFESSPPKSKSRRSNKEKKMLILLSVSLKQVFSQS